MESKKILKEMNDIEDRYIEEASFSRKERTEVRTNTSAKTGRKKRGGWKVWTGTIAAALVLVIGIGGAASGWFGGYGAKSSGRYMAQNDTASGGWNSGYKSEESYNEWVSEAEAPQDWAESEPAYAEDKSISSNSVNMSANKASEESAQATGAEEQAKVKLIYRANLSVQTTDFDETMSEVQQLIKSCGGYVESSYTNNGSYYSNGYYMNASLTVRVPSDRYKDFVSGINGTCYVTYINESVEDVGLQYFEVERRLETLYTKQERLNELLSQAITMGDIIELENALADTEYMIDMYKSSLNRYDSLINYSTVTIDIQTVTRPDGGVVEDQGFFARLGRSLKNGAANFLDGIGNFILWVSYNLLTLILIVVIVIVLRLIWLRIRRNRDAKKRLEE